jgi:hypothetical protein
MRLVELLRRVRILRPSERQWLVGEFPELIDCLNQYTESKLAILDDLYQIFRTAMTGSILTQD